MPSDFYSVSQLDFVKIRLNLNPTGNVLFEHVKDMPCALVWYQVVDPGKPKPKKHFRQVIGGRVNAVDADWRLPGVLVTPRVAIALCQQFPGVLGMAIVLNGGNNLSCLDIDVDTENPGEAVRYMANDYQEQTSNGGMHYLCVGRLGRNMTKPHEFYSGDHLLTCSFDGVNALKRNDDALDHFDSTSISFDIEQFRPILTRDDRQAATILSLVQQYEPKKFNELYMTLHAPTGTAGYDASSADMALIMSIMDYTRDTDLVYQVFLTTGFGQRLINRAPGDKKKGKNYLHNSIRKALPRQAMFWLAMDFKAANPALFHDPNFWPSAYGDLTPIDQPSAFVAIVDEPQHVAAPRTDKRHPLYPDLPNGGMFSVIEDMMYHGYFVANRHFAKMHALDTVNSLLMPFYIFNNRTRSNMFKVVTGPTSAGKGMVLQSSSYLRMANNIVDETMRGHKQPFIDVARTPIRERYVTGPMQGSVRGLDKLYGMAFSKRPVIAVKERDFTQSLEAFFSDVATTTGPARNLAELGDECTDLFDLSLPGRHLETKATGKTDAIIIPEPMFDITFEGTQEPLLTSIAPDGSNLASGRVNRWIFFIHDEYFPTTQRALTQMQDVNMRGVMDAYLAPLLLKLVHLTNNCDDPINAVVTEALSAYEFDAYEKAMVKRRVMDLPQGARDTYARVRMNVQKMAMLFAMERHASGLTQNFELTSNDIDLAYDFVMPGYDYIASNFAAGNIGNVDDHDYIFNGAMLIRDALKAFYLNEREYGAWLSTVTPEQAERYRRLGIVPFKPVREKLWSNSIFNSRKLRQNKSVALNACLQFLEDSEYALVDRGTNEKNQAHAGLCAANGLRAVNEPMTNRMLVRVLR